MLLLELKKYFNRKSKLFISVSVAILIISIFSFINIYKFFLRHDISKMNVHNYIIGELNMIQLMMFIVFPTLFSILTSDLILSDIDSGYINFILPRLKNRLIYVINKIFIVILIAILFTVAIITSKYIIAIITRTPLTGSLSIQVASVLHHKTLLNMYIYNIVYFISGLILVGMLSIFISINIKNAGIAVGIMILISFLHNGFYTMYSKYISILPYTQYSLMAQDDLKRFGLIRPDLTLKFSFVYIWISIFILFILIFYKIKKHEIRGRVL